MGADFKIDFLGLGPAKAGTTWIGHMLESHPQICMAEPKEVHFFNDSLSFNGSFSESHFPLGLDWYKNFYKHCASGTIKGEFTPRYILDPVVPERIFQHNPDMKLIVCLRPPFQRIVSHYHSVRDYHHKEPRAISVAIREEPEYLDACMYYRNISRFLKYYKLDQFFFADLEEIKTNPRDLVRRLYTFLEVDPEFIPSTIDKKSNPARRTRSEWFWQFSWKTHRKVVEMGFSPLIRTLKTMGVGRLVNRLNSGKIEIVRLTPEDKVFIKERLEEDVTQFGKLLSKDFSNWLKI